MINQHTKFEVYNYVHPYEDINVNEKCRNWGSLGLESPKVTGNVTI